MTIRWTAPAGCPDRDDLVAAVERHLGGPLQAPGRRPLVAEVEVRAEGGAWRLRLTTRGADGDGERELWADTCAEAAEATALVLALAIDPQAVAAAAAVPAPPPALATVAVNRELPPLERAAPAPAAAPGAAWRASAGAAVAGDLGTLPGGGLGGAAALRLWRGRVGLELAGSYWPTRRAESGPGRGGDIGLWGGGLRLCLAAPLDACLGVEIGDLHGSAFGVNMPQSGSARWSALSAALARSWRLGGPLGVRVEGELLLGLERPTFFIDGLGDVHRPAAVAGRLLIGPEVYFP